MGDNNFGNRMKSAVKGLMIGTLLAASLVGFSSNAFAAQSHSVSVKVNGSIIQMYEAPAYVDTKTNMTYVPLRFVSEALGAEIDYVSNAKPIKASIDEPESHNVSITLNSKKVTIDGKSQTIDGAPVLQNGRTMVPLRVISEGLGAEVKFTPGGSGKNAVVEVNTPWKTPTQTPAPTTKPSTGTGQYDTWKPNENQQVSGPIVFKPLTWDASTRTLTFNLPKTTKFDGDTYTVEGAYGDGSKEAVIKTGETQTLKGLSEKFIVAIYFNATNVGKRMDSYFIMSKSYAMDRYGYKGSVDDELVVYDAHKNLVTLDAVYKALGINK